MASIVSVSCRSLIPPLLLAAALAVGCGRPEAASAESVDETPAASDPAGPQTPDLPAAESEPAPSPAGEATGFSPAERLLEPWFGDFEEMTERRLIRALVTYSKTHYFLDGATERGIAVEALRQLEEDVNRRLGRDKLKVRVALLPVARDQLVPALVGGRGDLAVANLTVTSERRQQVDFSEPTATGVKEIVVTGPGGPDLARLEDLAGREVWVRPSSSYRESLEALNREFAAAGLATVEIRAAEEYLESEDLLEMVNAGLLGISVIDEHVAHFWAQIFEDLKLHPELAVRTGGEIAWILRKETPGLRAVVDEFVAKNKKGTLLGNILFKRYLKSTRWVRNSLADEELARFRSMVG